MSIASSVVSLEATPHGPRLFVVAERYILLVWYEGPYHWRHGYLAEEGVFLPFSERMHETQADAERECRYVASVLQWGADMIRYRKSYAGPLRNSAVQTWYFITHEADGERFVAWAKQGEATLSHGSVAGIVGAILEAIQQRGLDV